MKWLILLLTSISLNAASQNPYPWINEQINSDLKEIPLRSIPTKQLACYFEKLCNQQAQALYAKVRNNKISWRSSPRTDPFRNDRIFAYFKQLLENRSLPNMDFILLSDDGCSEKMELPVLSFSASPGNNACLFPDFEMLWELTDPQKNWGKICKKLSKDYPWHIKFPQAFFRGAGTGAFVNDISKCDQNARMRVIFFSTEFPTLVDAALTTIESPIMREVYTQLGKSLCGAPISTHFQYKYLLDIDGHANTYSRCRWILLSNSVLVKVMSPVSQWYYKAMKPWVHYVPIQQDLSDLETSLSLLIKDDALAKQIAENGQGLGKKIFSPKTVEIYVIRLLHEYAKRLIIN